MHKDPNPAAAPKSAPPSGPLPTNLDAFWMPFTASRQFKSAPRMLAKAKDMHYWTPDGRQILDAVAGLWCVNAGHARPSDGSVLGCLPWLDPDRGAARGLAR